jgi:hypothetical protein
MTEEAGATTGSALVCARRWRPVIVAALAAVCATRVCALDDDFEATVRRLVDGLYQLRGTDQQAEQALVAKGSSRADAGRVVRGLADGFVRCLLNEQKSYAADHQESFAKRLRGVQHSLDRDGAGQVLQDLLETARAQRTSGDACGFDELRKVGLTVDGLS